MAKYKSGSHLQKYFLIFGVLFSIAALGIIVFASQQKTNTLSEASGGCLDKPKLVFVEAINTKAKFMDYHLKLINNCPNRKRFIISATEPTKPVHYKNWRWGFVEYYPGGGYSGNLDNQPITTRYIDKSQYIALMTANPKITITGKNIPNGDYKYFTVRASLEKNSSIYDTINLIYTVDSN